jgi:pimeloyl-ACP methyl ester carboxylesterase
MDLVCLNGVVPARMTFAALVRELSPLGVDLCDLAGYATALPADYRLDTELAAITATVGPRPAIHLLGYSAGASIALAYAVRHPHAVASLTLVEPPWTGLPDPSGFTERMDDIMLRTPPELRWPIFHDLLTRPGADVPPPPAEPPAWASQRVDRGGDIWRALRAESLSPALVGAFAGPVYLPYADDSHPFFATTAHTLAGLFPDARVEEYRGNHIRPPHVSEPARFAAALRERWSRH